MKDAKATFDVASSGVYALYKSNGYIIAMPPARTLFT